MTLLLLACSAPHLGTDAQDTDSASADDTAAQTNPDDTALEAMSWPEVFDRLDRRCSGCHESDYPSGAGFMVPGDAAATYTNLVSGDVSDLAADAGWFAYVVGGHPEMSLLSEKLGAAPSLGDPMPPPYSQGTGRFDAAEVAALNAWIDQGAPTEE